MNNKHKRTLKAIFHEPALSNILWIDIETLFISLGATVKEGNGSRVRVRLNDVLATFHRPHPQKEARKGAVEAVRAFLTNAGVKI